LETESLNQFLGTNGMYFNTSSFAQYVPMFEMKLGKNVPLHAMLVAKDIKILFG
jgi:hypothetical protein